MAEHKMALECTQVLAARSSALPTCKLFAGCLSDSVLDQSN